jgi:hypothetical protein
MAVDADDFALLDLAVKDIDCGARCDESRDPGRLLAYVVELEHDWIALAAVDARMFAKVRDNVGMEDACSRLLRRIRLAAVEIPARPEVRGEARSAPPLMTVAKTVEELEGKVVAAPAAVAHLTRAPDAQGTRWTRAGRPLRRSGRRLGREHVAHPHAHR